MTTYVIDVEGGVRRFYKVFEEASRVALSLIEMGLRCTITIVGEARDMLVRLHKFASEKNILLRIDDSKSPPAAIEYLKSCLPAGLGGGIIGAGVGTGTALIAQTGAAAGTAGGPPGVLMGIAAGFAVGAVVGVAIGILSVKFGVRVKYVAAPTTPPDDGQAECDALELEFVPAK